MNQRRIVCAANFTPRDGGVIFLGARHFDGLMRTAIGAYFLGERVELEEGFIDQFGDFHTRTEAWKIAEAAEQILRRCGGDDADGGTLYSENLY
jgi:hypothetical protein